MGSQVSAKTNDKEQQLKKASKMSLIRSLLPIVGLVVIFLLFNVLTDFRMMGNMSLVLSQVYVTMIAAMGVFFIMTMGGLDFSQGSILGISSIVVCILSQKSIPLAIIGGIASGAAIGALNGYFYVFRKIKSFIVTICTMFLFRGFIKYLTTNVDFQAEFSVASGYVPVLKSVANNEAYADFVAKADGGDYISALSAKVCLAQADTYYTSPAFLGSSTARDQVGALLAKCLTLPDNGNVDAAIEAAFEDAIDECEYAY